MPQFRTQDQLVFSLRRQLATTPRQALRALVFLYNCQTDVERELRQTRHFNGVGFNHNDARRLTVLAQEYISRGRLDPDQMRYVLDTIPKYARQLVRHSLASGKIRKENGYYTW